VEAPHSVTIGYAVSHTHRFRVPGGR